jgi:hypothetical protein
MLILGLVQAQSLCEHISNTGILASQAGHLQKKKQSQKTIYIYVRIVMTGLPNDTNPLEHRCLVSQNYWVVIV